MEIRDIRPHASVSPGIGVVSPFVYNFPMVSSFLLKLAFSLSPFHFFMFMDFRQVGLAFVDFWHDFRKSGLSLAFVLMMSEVVELKT